MTNDDAVRIKDMLRFASDLTRLVDLASQAQALERDRDKWKSTYLSLYSLLEDQEAERREQREIAAANRKANDNAGQ